MAGLPSARLCLVTKNTFLEVAEQEEHKVPRRGSWPGAARGTTDSGRSSLVTSLSGSEDSDGPVPPAFSRPRGVRCDNEDSGPEAVGLSGDTGYAASDSDDIPADSDESMSPCATTAAPPTVATGASSPRTRASSADAGADARMGTHPAGVGTATASQGSAAPKKPARPSIKKRENYRKFKAEAIKRLEEDPATFRIEELELPTSVTRKDKLFQKFSAQMRARHEELLSTTRPCAGRSLFEPTRDERGAEIASSSQTGLLPTSPPHPRPLPVGLVAHRGGAGAPSTAGPTPARASGKAPGALRKL